MPRAPRPPRALGPPGRPQAPRAPRLGSLRLNPIRSEGSVELDAKTTKSGYPFPPYKHWDVFFAEWKWESGEHITSIGPTGSGKTVLNRYLLRKAPIPERGGPGPFVVVLGIKSRDKELYGPYQREGYQRVTRFDPNPDEDVWEQRLIFAPQTERAGSEGRHDRSRALRQALQGIEKAGYWTVYADDIQYMAQQLGLAIDFEEIWIKGRSEGISLVASSQEPRHIPVMAYGQATHLFLFKNTDKDRADRLGELSGVNREIVRETVLELPDHEFVYINKSTGRFVRSMVIRRD